MPLYGYQCRNCDHSFDVRQSFHDDPVAVCPQCENQAHRVFSPVPIIFKGSGWYVNDYGPKSQVPTKTETNDKGSKSPEKATNSSEKATSSSEKATSTPKGSATEGSATSSTVSKE